MELMECYMSQSLLNLVEKYWEEDAKLCWDCPHLRSWVEGHGEKMNECSVLTSGQHAELCPGIVNELEKQTLTNQIGSSL